MPPRRTWGSRPRDVAISAALLSGGEIRGVYHKVLLPTHGAYDEARTFAAGARIILAPNASPYWSPLNGASRGR